MIENTVAFVGPIRGIKDQSNQNFSHSRRELTHDQCSNMIFKQLLIIKCNFVLQESKAHEKSMLLNQIIPKCLVIQFMILQKIT